MTLELALKVTPWLVLLGGLVWRGFSLWLTKLIDDRVKVACDKMQFDLRTEFQKPIGEIGIDVQRATETIEELGRTVDDLQTKTDVFWKMVEHSTAGMLRRPKSEG